MLKFKMKDLGPLKFFLGIEFARSKERVIMSQRKYALELISELGLRGAKPVYAPLDPSLRLTSIDYDSQVNDSGEDPVDKSLKNIGKYQRLVEKLLYLTMTRVDIFFFVQILSQFMHAHKESHMEAAIRMMKFVKTSPGLGLFIPSQGSDTFTIFCDSDWGICLQTRRD